MKQLTQEIFIVAIYHATDNTPEFLQFHDGDVTRTTLTKTSAVRYDTYSEASNIIDHIALPNRMYQVEKLKVVIPAG